ncbi:MAG: 30S ribosomal protein S21 [Proteobacteria bacterium]|jgi:ribosomal protein S21|nr:30S ribosomal protein S21 [Pseudomonadota bacterium]
MNENGERPKKKRIRKELMYVPGGGIAVKVVDNNVEAALRLFKKMVKDSDIMDMLKERTEFTPKSIEKRKQLELAIRKQYLRSKAQ